MDKPNFSHNVKTSATRWAPVLLEPIPGSEERIVIAIAAINESEMRCSQTIDPAIARAVFRDDRKYVADLIDLVTESLGAHLKHNKSLGQWPPPVEGVFLGSEQESRFSDIDELVRRAGSMSTVFHGEYFRPQSKDPKPVRWTDEVSSILVSRNERLRDHLDVRVHLGQYDAPARFTFLDAFFAANLVTFSKSNLNRRVEQARAGLWNLSLLKDGPMLFRPERRELLAGIEYSDQTAGVNVREAIDEISDEASRRDVLVTELPSPEAVAEHILHYASAQA